MKYGSSGNPFTTFNLATTDSWVKDGQREERTEWHRIIAFGKLAEICAKYLHKGKQIYLEGRIQTRSWEQDGVKRYTTEIIAGTMQMLGSRDGGGQSGGQGGSYGGGQNQGQGGGFAASESQTSPAGQAPYGRASTPDSGPDDIPF
jgi:single-strand DNA-binding protein